MARLPRSATHASATDVACRALDIVCALLILVVLAPLMAAIAVAVRLDSPGGAMFHQRRLGRHRRPLTVHKFRTMTADADPSLHEHYVSELIGGRGDAGDGLYKLTNDARVTRVGGWLRRYSLDELPQLWNVLRGDMSLVGPRPVMEYEAARYPASYERRFDVKPGLTGLWQVSGRNTRTYEEMIHLDIEYAERRSLRLYVEILLRSVVVVLKGTEAA